MPCPAVKSCSILRMNDSADDVAGLTSLARGCNARLWRLPFILPRPVLRERVGVRAVWSGDQTKTLTLTLSRSTERGEVGRCDRQEVELHQ